MSSNSVLFQKGFGYSRSFEFPYELQNQLLNSYQKAHKDFEWHYSESIDQLGEKWYLNNIKSFLISKHDVNSPFF